MYEYSTNEQPNLPFQKLSYEHPHKQRTDRLLNVMLSFFVLDQFLTFPELVWPLHYRAIHEFYIILAIFFNKALARFNL